MPCNSKESQSLAGADPGFLNRGGTKDYGAHQDHEARSLIRLGSRARGSTSVLDAFLCYLSLILKHSDTKRVTKNVVSQNLEGARTCCAPLWIRHWSLASYCEFTSLPPPHVLIIDLCNLNICKFLRYWNEKDFVWSQFL